MRRTWVGLIVLCFVFTLQIGLSLPGYAAAPTNFSQIADSKVQNLAGDIVPLSTVVKGVETGRWTLMVFWATWCPYCAAELADLAKHYDELSAMGVDILAISIDGNIEGIKQHIEKKWTRQMPAVLDRGSLMSQLLLRGVPNNQLIAPDGKIIWRGWVYTNYSYLVTLINNAKAKATGK